MRSRPKSLAGAGFQILATSGTYDRLAKHDVPTTRISKLAEGRPNIKDYIVAGICGGNSKLETRNSE